MAATQRRQKHLKLSGAEIVKVQVPIVNYSKTPLVLVYSKGRSRVREQPLTPDLQKKLGGQIKAFFYAYYSSTVGWAIAERAPPQDW